MHSIVHKLLILALLLCPALFAGQAVAQQINKRALKQQAALQRASSGPIDPVRSVLDVNNMTTWVENNGFFNWIDPFTGENGSYPKRQAWAVFSQGIVWGGRVMDGKTPQIRVNGSTYANGLAPGRVLRDGAGNVTGPDQFSPEKYHVWRVHRKWNTTLDYTAAASYFFGVGLNEVTDDQRQQLRQQYEFDWNNWPAEWGAPFEDVDGDGQYNPSVDIPGWPGADQTLWIVANDLPPGISEISYGSPPIGIEYQLTIWGYDFPASSPLGNLSFERARIIYTGQPDTPADARIDSMFVVQWADPDVGTFSNDYAGSDTTLGLGYAYNAGTSDDSFAEFGLAPAAVGWDFLQGPINAEGDTLDMTAFVFFAAGSDISDPELGEYVGTLEWFNLMRGLRPQPEFPAGDPFVNPLTGEVSKFTLAGDPVTGSGWIDGMTLPPGDRRIVLSSGPFTMQLGDTVDVFVGQVGGLGTNNLSSVTVMKFHDQFAQFAYDNDFQLPSPPAAPPVEVTELDGQIVLNWGSNLNAVQEIEASENQGFAFEGYNVYQLPTASSSISEGVKFASYDKVNLFSTIFDNVIDEETGFVIQRPVQISPNEGLKRFETITRDRIRNRPLANGVEYHFAVTSYSVLTSGVEDAPFRILESSPVVVTVTPQPPRPGAEEPPALDDFELQHTGTSTSDVQVSLVDPSKLVSGSHQVGFAFYNPATGEGQTELAPGDTLTSVAGLFEATEYSEANQVGVGDPFPTRWALFRGGQRVSAWHPLLDPAGDIPAQSAPILDGLQVYVPFVSGGVAGWDFDGTRWVTGVNWGGADFFGGLDIGHNFFGSGLPLDQLADVELEFQGGSGVPPSEGFVSKGATFIRGEGYVFSGIGELPFAAYEVDADGNRRQLNVSYVEATTTCANLVWDMGLMLESPPEECDLGLGGREYIFIHKSDYNEGADYTDVNILNDAGSLDVMYAIWPTQRGDHPYLEAPFTMQVFAAVGLTPNDVFSFEVEAPAEGVQELAEAAVDEINVFPNPYLGFSSLETSRFQKFVTFTHLPDQATIRIFTLGGVMVRRIDHDSPSQFERWDLTNQDNIPVASGLYLVHIETDFGEKVLKLALVQEEQILQRY